MAAVDEVAEARGLNLNGAISIAEGFWLWFYNHQKDTITIPVHVWFMNMDVKVTLDKLRPLFVLLFGEDPRR